MWRWMQRFAPEVDQGLRRHLRPTNRSWRVDETYVRVKGRWCCLHYAIDSDGASIEFFLSAFRDLEAAKSLFRRPLRNSTHPQSRVVNTDLAPTYTPAIPALRRSGVVAKRCLDRPVQYFNKIIEQNHRAIKKRVNAKQGSRAFGAARRTSDGYELIHMMRKGQVRWLPADGVKRQIQFIAKLFGLST